MCVLCGNLAGEPHWTERRLDGNPTGGYAHEPQRRQDRFRRIRLLRRVLSMHTMSVHDDLSATRYVISNGKGSSEVVAHLGEVWTAAHRLAGRPIDPLDGRLLDELEGTLRYEP
jgi:hypothetical protein